ncbi:uncharacterized protein LOC122193628 [Lagopus leucura]|uniref:uncharacterized protein LOC122193628 n=1 Tax=Lagopus leucura TaxID=30410 RepID=UPI001C67CBDF|nr:uncharacterized protein LOC122193628 [Lagopus leucura]
MEQSAKPCTKLDWAELLQGQMVTSSKPGSFSSRFLHQVLQLGLVRSLLKILQKVSVWVGFVVPMEAIIGRICPVQSPHRPTRFAKKRRGRLTRLLLAFIPTRIQAVLGHLHTDWGQKSNVSKEIREALINPSSKANKRKRDDVALEEQESWVVVLEKDLPEDDPEDLSYEPSEVNTDTEEYESQNSTETDLEFEEHEGAIMLKESLDLQLNDVQPNGDNPEPLATSSEQGQEDPAASSSAEDASNDDSGDSDTQTPQDVSSRDSSEQEADVEHESSSSSQCGGQQKP